MRGRGLATLAGMEDILVTEDRTERSNDGRSTALTEEIELRVRRGAASTLATGGEAADCAGDVAPLTR